MRFEFLPAFKGDCFLIHGGTEAAPVLILVDGGPSGTYEQHLRKRLMALREERGLDEFTPLTIDLVIVSHVDDDHINGIIDLFRDLFESAKLGETPPFEVRGLWHNSFDEIIGNDEVAAGAAQFGAASFAPLMDEVEDQKTFDAGLILQSVSQGHELRDLAGPEGLNVPINEGFPGLVRTTEGELTVRELGRIAFTIIGPRPAELAELQEKHDAWLEEQKRQGGPVTPGSMLQSLTDKSVANLSSIVLLAERDGRKALLTGDARSDFVVKGLEETGLVGKGAGFAVDLLKMPHHGSDRNVDEDFLTRVTAPAYLFTGNGEHGNPERGTFEMLAKVRADSPMKLYLTYPVATIDPERRRVHEHERDKELARQKEGKLKPPKSPRPEWSDADHGLASLIAALPANIEVVEPKGPIVEL
ncbi:MAG TPA: MBL fold metallo-hydrolase [Allosphingosinicella sp.]|nr:MBL fold metallo-hydrolase [Allosphingosinicella sp.]